MMTTQMRGMYFALRLFNRAHARKFIVLTVQAVLRPSKKEGLCARWRQDAV